MSQILSPTRMICAVFLLVSGCGTQNDAGPLPLDVEAITASVRQLQQIPDSIRVEFAGLAENGLEISVRVTPGADVPYDFFRDCIGPDSADVDVLLAAGGQGGLSTCSCSCFTVFEGPKPYKLCFMCCFGTNKCYCHPSCQPGC